MRPMTPSQRLIRLTQFILSGFKTPEQQQNPGILFNGEAEQQSIIDKDNVGWVYVKPPPTGNEPPKRG